MAYLAVRSFTTIGYIGGILLIGVVAVLALTSLGDGNGSEPPAGAGTTATDAAKTPGGEEPTDDDTEVVTVGPSGDFTSINEAIEEASPGGIVEIGAGVYDEQVFIDDTVTLRPAGDGEVWIDRNCAEGSGIHVRSGSRVVIQGIGIRNTDSAGVIIGFTEEGEEVPEYVTVDGMSIENFNCPDSEDQYNAGIAVWTAGCCMTITNNTITYRTSGFVKGWGNGIWFKSTDEQPSGGGHTVSGNTITGGWDGIGGEAEGDDHGTFDRDSVIEGNIVRDCWDDGIQVEGGNVNIRVTGNTVSGCGTGIAFAPTKIGPLYVERNYIHDLSIGEYENLFCFKIGYEQPGEVYLTENRCQTEGDGILKTNAGLPTIISRGNCFNVTRYVLTMSDSVPPGTSFDGDTMWTSDPQRFVEWRDTQYYSLEEFQAGTGFEATGRESPDCHLDQG
jgi:parallel beta-helix repeat protein